MKETDLVFMDVQFFGSRYFIKKLIECLRSWRLLYCCKWFKTNPLSFAPPHGSRTYRAHRRPVV